jgi:hypothetical protein
LHDCYSRQVGALHPLRLERLEVDSRSGGPWHDWHGNKKLSGPAQWRGPDESILMQESRDN